MLVGLREDGKRFFPFVCWELDGELLVVAGVLEMSRLR